ncbi:hypothetical protein FRC07_007100 [Ceratobasidium sp. 392]|nr:hypothetical protein FRC07_007100 [Ceratobasidium sp. 392]
MLKNQTSESDSAGVSSQPLDAILQSALNEWENARKLLDSSIKSILGVYLTVFKTYALPQCKSPESSVVQVLLARFDSEIEALAKYENELVKMRFIAMLTRKNSAWTKTTSNSLPPEVLTRIFVASDTCFTRDTTNRLHNFAGVCKHWRQIASNMTAHVDVGPAVPSSLTKIQLERTGDHSIYVHVREPATVDGSATTEQISTVVELLATHIHRIRVLEIESYSFSRKLAGSVLNLWLENGSQLLPKTLMVSRPKAGAMLSPTESKRTLLSRSEYAQVMLKSLTRLHLQNVMFDWDSSAYHGLVELRLHSSCSRTSASISQLVGILSASPALIILELSYLDITSSPDWSSAPINLSYLRVFTLFEINWEGLRLLLPLISLPISPIEIGIGPTPFDMISNELEAFLIRAPHLIALKLKQHELYTFLNWLPLLRALPRLDALLLSDFCIDELTAEVITAAQDPPNSMPRLRMIMCSECMVSLEGLKAVVTGRGVESVYLGCCVTRRGSVNNLKAVRVSLLEANSELLRCTISDDSLTKKFKNLRLFDWME